MFVRLVRQPTVRGQRSSFPQRNFKRYYAAPVTKDLFVFGEPEDYKLAIPLPQIGTRVFSLSERQKLRSFAENIQLEDLGVKSISITDPTGAIISSGTRTEELLQDDWVLKVNDVSYLIRSPPLAKEGRLRVTQSHPKFKQVEEFFKSKLAESPHLVLAQYIKFTEDIGLTEEQANDILSTASQLGIVLHLDRNIELDKVIFLQPQQVTTSLDSMLDLPSIRRSYDEKVALLDKYRSELVPMAELSQSCLERADTIAHRIATAGFVGLCVQFFVYARLTWWESDWDVMEPITYFTTVLETVILGKFWFLWAGSEYAHMDLRQALLAWQLKKQQRKKGFNPVAFQQLKDKIVDLENEIKFEKQK